MFTWKNAPAPRAKLQTTLNVLITLLAVGLAIFHLYTAAFGLLAPLNQRSIHLVTLLMLCFFTYNLLGNKDQGVSPDGFILALASLGIGYYLLGAFTPQLVQERGIMGPTRMDYWVGIILLILILEGTRRAVGLAIVLVALAFIGYGVFGSYMPEFISHRGYSIDRITGYIVWSTEGVFGTPLAVSATFVIIFIMFGAFMDKLGAGSLFIDLAVALTGRVKGGPALTSVLGSGLMGSINGSSVSNVVTTGTFTIPLMKRTGYKPNFAAGVEAVASTGGQIMPPIMGAGAFVMAEMIGIPYSDIALFAIIPALLYFCSIGLMVYFEAYRRQIPVLDLKEIPSVKARLAKGFYLFIPLIVLVYLLVVKRWSPMLSGVTAIAILVGVASVATLIRDKRLPLAEILDALRQGVLTAIPVALACASAGIVIGIVSMTGLGVRFTQMIVEISGGQLWLGALLTMGACIILGMGLPTTAAYIITAVLGAPALEAMGVSTIAAHMFIFYFAIISFITPPVGLSAYAASGVAGTNPLTTSIMAFKLGIAGFIVPFVFIYEPAILLQGSIVEISVATLTALLGITLLAASIVGWFLLTLGSISRVMFFASAIVLIAPLQHYSAIGLIPMALYIGIYASQRRGRNQPLNGSNESKK